MRRAIATLLTLSCLWAAPSAHAVFDFADVNTGDPNHAVAPAFPGTKAVWVGTCDLASGSTSNGGVGTAPAIRPHCIDTGDHSTGAAPPSTSPWPAGLGPGWRLDPATEAGGHPDATATFWFGNEEIGPGGDVKNVIVQLPPGVIGNPEAVQKCPALAAQAVPPECSASGQSGISTIGFPLRNASEVSDLRTYPIYAIEARDTVTAEFTVASVGGYFNVPITARGRTNGDYGVDTLALLIPQFAFFGGQTATFWGVPWAEQHDKFRVDGLSAGRLAEFTHTGAQPQFQVPYDPSWGPIRPFFTNPTECSGKPVPVTMVMDSWQEPVFEGFPWLEADVFADPVTGCDELEFEPQVTLRPTVSVSDSPSGLDVKLSTPQNNDPPDEALGNPNLAFDPSDDTGAPAYWRTPAGRGSAHLKDTTVRLPQGTSFNPAAANGIEGCTTAQIGLTATQPKATFNNDPHKCPDSSKVGTLQINTPLLPDPLHGAVYAAPQHDNPFPGSLTAIYLVAQDEERGLSVKLAGKVDLDPDTGQIATTFVDNPQLPFEDFILHLKTGPRAPLNTPPVCGQFKNSVGLIPWSFPASGPEPVIEDPFDITQAPNSQPCVTEPEDRLFTPGFASGSSSAQAKAYTHFTMDVTRIDGQQEFASLAVELPPGLSANLTETPYCPEHLIAAAKVRSGTQESLAPSCPQASRMGHVTALAGAGSMPLPTTGNLYIAGPWDPDGSGPRALAPFSIVVVAPAIAGGTATKPAFDLGNVVIRSAGYVDPRTARVTIASTPVPYIVGGVPLRIRHIQVAIEKPNFMLNPTNCDPLAIGAGIGGAADPFDPADDSLATPASPFQVRGCKDLGFKPSLKLRFFGKARRGANQRLQAELTAREGDANIARAAVTLPPSTFLDQTHLNNICTRVQFAAGACPPGSVYGYAKAWTPLLKDPVEGPVYLRSSDNPLPDMVASLQGQFDVELVGRIDSVKLGKEGGVGIRSIFDVIPDAPVSKFVLNMRGGSHSLIENSENICANPGRANLRLKGHNGRTLNQRLAVKSSACKNQRKGNKGAKGRGKAKRR